MIPGSWGNTKPWQFALFVSLCVGAGILFGAITPLHGQQTTAPKVITLFPDGQVYVDVRVIEESHTGAGYIKFSRPGQTYEHCGPYTISY